MKYDLTLAEMLDAIKQQWDPWYLLEVLDIDFERLVDLLQDVIEEEYETILEELE